MFKLIKQGNSYNDQVPYFVCDNYSELDNIPLTKGIKDSIGDRVFVINESKYYIRNSNGEWKEDLSTGGSGQSQPCEIEITSFN